MEAHERSLRLIEAHGGSWRLMEAHWAFWRLIETHRGLFKRKRDRLIRQNSDFCRYLEALGLTTSAWKITNLIILKLVKNDLDEIVQIFESWNFPKLRYLVPKMLEMANIETRHSQKLSTNEIWMVDKFWNFHTVPVSIFEFFNFEECQ